MEYSYVFVIAGLLLWVLICLNILSLVIGLFTTHVTGVDGDFITMVYLQLFSHGCFQR